MKSNQELFRIKYCIGLPKYIREKYVNLTQDRIFVS